MLHPLHLIDRITLVFVLTHQSHPNQVGGCHHYTPQRQYSQHQYIQLYTVYHTVTQTQVTKKINFKPAKAKLFLFLAKLKQTKSNILHILHSTSVFVCQNSVAGSGKSFSLSESAILSKITNKPEFMHHQR